MTAAAADALSEAIENLYRVFAPYQLQPLMEHCAHCVSDEDFADLQSAPLRELTAERLERFAFKAMTTWGDASDFRHFLPRLLELAAPGNELEFGGLTAKLEYGRWRTWPRGEQDAIEQFLMTLWQAILRSPPTRSWAGDAPRGLGLSLDEFLEAVVPLGSIARYVDFWEREETLPALRHLADFALVEGNSLLMQLNRKQALSPTEQQQLLLLRQPWVRERLEAAFFAPPVGCTDAEFSLIVSRLDWLDTIQLGEATL